MLLHANLTAHLTTDVRPIHTHTHGLLVNQCVRLRVVDAKASVNASVALPEKYIYCLIMWLFSIIHAMRPVLDHPLMNRAGQGGAALRVIHWCGRPPRLSRPLAFPRSLNL